MLTAVVSALLTISLAALFAAPAPDHPAAPHSHGLDMEVGNSEIPPGVTPEDRRLPVGEDSGGPGLEYLAGSEDARVSSARGTLQRTGFGAGEPTLGVTKDGTLFFQALDGPPAVIRSRNGGRTWQDVSPRLGERNRHPTTLDPFLWVDPDTGRVFTYDFFFGCSELSFSDDAGETWITTPFNCGLQDHQNLFAGPAALSTPIGYENVVYSCSTQLGATIYSIAAQCLKSLDGGLTWAPTGSLPYVTQNEPENDLGINGYCHGAVGHGFVGEDGTVYVPKGLCGEPWLSFSHDEGLTWQRVQVAKNGVPQTNIGVYEHEASVAADAKGNVYYFWMSGNRLPHLAVSKDGGETWGKPIPVGPPGLKEATLPHLTVGAPGKVAVVYYGSTNSPGKPFPQYDDCKDKMVECFSNLFFLNPPDPKRYEDVTWNGYMTISANALEKRPRFHSVTINDPSDPFVRGTCGPIRCKTVYDFIDVVIDRQGKPWGSYVDICILECARQGPNNQGNEGVVGTIKGGPKLR